MSDTLESTIQRMARRPEQHHGWLLRLLALSIEGKGVVNVASKTDLARLLGTTRRTLNAQMPHVILYKERWKDVGKVSDVTPVMLWTSALIRSEAGIISARRTPDNLHEVCTQNVADKKKSNQKKNSPSPSKPTPPPKGGVVVKGSPFPPATTTTYFQEIDELFDTDAMKKTLKQAVMPLVGLTNLDPQDVVSTLHQCATTYLKISVYQAMQDLSVNARTEPGKLFTFRQVRNYCKFAEEKRRANTADKKAFITAKDELKEENRAKAKAYADKAQQEAQERDMRTCKGCGQRMYKGSICGDCEKCGECCDCDWRQYSNAAIKALVNAKNIRERVGDDDV